MVGAEVTLASLCCCLYFRRLLLGYTCRKWWPDHFSFKPVLFFPRQAISSMRLDDPERLIDFISGLVQVLSAVMKEGNVFVFVNCVLVSCRGRRGICISFQWRISAALVVYNFADNEGIFNSYFRKDFVWIFLVGYKIYLSIVIILMCHWRETVLRKRYA